MKKFFLIALLLAFFADLSAQETDHLSVKAFSDKESYLPKDTVKIAVRLLIKEKYHINSYNTSDPSFIKTTITASGEDYKTLGIFFPEHKLYKFEFSDTQIPVYEGEKIIGITFIPAKDLKDGEISIPVKLNYQACDSKACYAPKNVSIDVKVKINSVGKSTVTNKDIFAKIDFSKPIQTETAETNNKLSENTRTEGASPDEEKVSNFIESKGIVLGIIMIFLWGLALNLTPCIYPLIPITISYFGAQASGSKLKGVVMGLFYAFGMAVTYSLLGLFAALTGSILGTALQNPIVIIGIALIFIALAASMFGLWEIRVPQKLALAGNQNRSGFVGSFLMGLLVGFIAAPCIGPIVLSLLVYVGKLGNPFMGFVLFFILSMGLGVPYIFLAAFSSSINKLPRSGEWMIGVKIIFGFVLVIMAINTLEPVIPAPVFSILYPASMLFAGIYLLIVDKKGLNAPVYTKIKFGLAIIGIIFGTWILKPENKGEEVHFNNAPSVQAIDNSVKTGGKPIMIDFYADWCAQCKELDKFTYTDKNVVELSKSFNNIKVDLTNSIPGMEEKFGIKGLPVVIFMKPNGEEIKELRVTGFLQPAEFEKRMKILLESK
jgi:thiol:disulfide interchange protein DsbD